MWVVVRLVSIQADGPHESLQRRGRPVAVTNEGRKAQSTLLHAQQIADDMYHGSLVRCMHVFLHHRRRKHHAMSHRKSMHSSTSCSVYVNVSLK